MATLSVDSTEDRVVAARGGSFLIEDRAPDEIFTPDDFSEEQRMMGATCAEWMAKDVAPRLSEILALNFATTRELMGKAGALGLLGIEVPQEHGGAGPPQGTAPVAPPHPPRS